MFIASEVKTSETAIKLAIGLADMLEMECAFTEPIELDSMIAAGWQLPYLASHALLNCITNRSSWNDGKKAAEKTFHGVTAPVSLPMDREEIGSALLNNREHTVRLLNEYIEVRKTFRDALQTKDEAALRTLLEEDEKALDRWLQDCRQTNLSSGNSPSVPIPTASEGFAQTFFGGLLRKKMRG